MYGSQRYRYNAAESLRAAQEARDHFHRKVHLSMALSWLSLAREDEAASPPTISAAMPQQAVLTELADRSQMALQAS